MHDPMEFLFRIPAFLDSTIVGFTSRRKNVPGQVKSSNITSMNAIKQILSCLVIRTDDGVYI